MSELSIERSEISWLQVYIQLEKSVITLNAKWNQFIELYATSENTVELLNKTANWFFKTFQRVLMDDILLSICRLTDPPEMGRHHQNLSLLRWPAFLYTVSPILQPQVHKPP